MGHGDIHRLLVFAACQPVLDLEAGIAVNLRRRRIAATREAVGQGRTQSKIVWHIVEPRLGRIDYLGKTLKPEQDRKLAVPGRDLLGGMLDPGFGAGKRLFHRPASKVMMG
jgi:hypothetical protein